MKITKENRYVMINSLKDLKEKISDNDIEDFKYKVQEKDSETHITLKFKIHKHS